MPQKKVGKKRREERRGEEREGSTFLPKAVVVDNMLLITRKYGVRNISNQEEKRLHVIPSCRDRGFSLP